MRCPRSLAGGIGPRIHFTRLQGALGDARLDVDTRRLVPGLGAMLQVGWQLAGCFFIELWATVDWLLIVQRYLVDGVRVPQSGRRRAALGLGLGISRD